MRHVVRGVLVVWVAAFLSVVLVVDSARAQTEPSPFEVVVHDATTPEGVFSLVTGGPAGLMGTMLVGRALGPVAAASGLSATGEAVAVGTGTRACKSGWTCAGVLAAALAWMAYLTRDTWIPWVQELITPGEIVGGRRVAYTGTQATKPCATPTVEGFPVDANGRVGVQTRVEYTLISNTISPSSTGCYAAPSRIVQCRNTLAAGGYRVVSTASTWYYAASSGFSRVITEYPCTGSGDTGQWDWLEYVGVNGTTGGGWQGHGVTRGVIIGDAAGAIMATDTVVSKLTCERPDGSTYVVSRSAAAATAPGLAVGWCAEGGLDASGLPVDKAQTLEVERLRPDGVNEPQVSYPVSATPDQEVLYPLCAGAACAYGIKVNGVRCEVGVWPCDSWAAYALRNPGAVECYYGPYAVPLTSCNWLERAYQPWPGSRVPGTWPNIDGNPDTYTGTPWTPLPSPAPSPSSGSSSASSSSSSVSVSSSASSATTPVGGTVEDTCAQVVTQYRLGAVQPETAAMVQALAPRFGVETVGGYRQSSSYSTDHPNGLAADFMTYTNKAMGDALSAYARENAAALNINYIIWQQAIWSVDRASEGWRPMADRGSITQNHYDHVHISVNDVVGSVSCSSYTEEQPSDACWPTGWGLFNPAEWVLRPVKCALQWAFVPRTEALDAARGRIDAAVAHTGLPAVVDAVRVPLTSIPDGSGCAGPSVDLQFWGMAPVHWQPLNACSEPLASFAALSRAVISLVVIVGAGLKLVHLVGSGFGYDARVSGGSE